MPLHAALLISLCAGSLGLVGTLRLATISRLTPFQVSGHMPHHLHLDFVVELSHRPLWRYGEDSLHSYVSFSPFLCYCHSVLNSGLSRFVNSLLHYYPRAQPFAPIAHYCLHGTCKFLEFRLTLIKMQATLTIFVHLCVNSTGPTSVHLLTFFIVSASLRTEYLCVGLIRFNIAQLLTPERCSQQTELGLDHSNCTQSFRYLHSSCPYL